jgi:ATP-binding cassette, subfamily B, bacterial
VNEPAPTPERKSGDLRLIRRLLGEARPLRGPLVVLLVVQVLATPLSLLAPVPIQLAVDQVLGGRPVPRWLAGVLPTSWQSADALLWVAAGATVLVALLLQAQQLAAW